MRLTTRSALGLLAVPALLAAVACSPTEEPDASDHSTPTSCAVADLALHSAGKLTVGTDSPAYEPWFMDDDPSNGEGYESAVAYAVAEKMGFAREDVEWTTVGFDAAFAPGEKKFDFDINQVSINADRAKAVDFSQGYYSAAQAVIVLDKNKGKVADASLASLADLKLGAQTATTSLVAITEVIKPSSDPMIFDNTNAAKQSLLNGQVDAIVADLPTALYITAAEIEGSSIVGQFQPDTGQQEEFGLVFEKGNPLVGCVDQALAELTSDGTLAALEEKWLSTNIEVPVLD